MKPVSEQWMVELVLQVESVLILDNSLEIPHICTKNFLNHINYRLFLTILLDILRPISQRL